MTVAATTRVPVPPSSLSLLLGPLQRGHGDPATRVDGAGAWWRASQTPAGAATLRLAGDGDAIAVEGWGPGRTWAVDRAAALLGAEDDPTGFVPLHPVIESTWRRLPHLRLGATHVVFELLAASVLEQRVTGAEAHRSWRELLWRFGEPAPGPAPRGLRVPPSPQVWRRIPSWEWHRAGVDPGRARTIVTAASRADRLEECLTLPREQRLSRLRMVPGVGAWTAAEVAQRAWADPDAVSVGDYHLPALVGWALAGRPVDDDGMLALLDGYAGHRHRAVRLVELSHVRKPAFGPRMPVADIRAI